jgi:hypothetical protein
MKNPFSIGQRRGPVLLGVDCRVALLVAAFALCLAAPARASAPPAPRAAFDQTPMASLFASPTITGEAHALAAPLSLVVTPLGATAPAYVQNSVPLDQNGRFSANVYPAIAVGTYAVSLSSGGRVLATTTLAVGLLSAPVVEVDPVAPYDAADGTLMHFLVRARGGPVALEQLTFAFATSGATLSAVSLDGYSDAQYATLIGSSTDPTLAALTDPLGPTATVTLQAPLVVPAGQTYYFALAGTVTPSGTTYQVQTSLVSDGLAGGFGTMDALASSTLFLWAPGAYADFSTTSPIWLGGLAADVPLTLTEVRQNAPAPTVPSCIVTASTSTIAKGGSATLSWTSIAATSGTWDDGTAAAPQGSRTVSNIAATRTFILNTQGPLGTATCFATVAVPTIIAAATTSQATSTGPSGTLAASPTKGAVTLSVTFSGSVNLGSACNATTTVYTLFYGDGGSSQIALGANTCRPVAYRFIHSYSKAGTYNAALYFGVSTTTGQRLASQTITATPKVATATFPNVANALNAVQSAVVDWPKLLQQFLSGFF